MKNKITTYNAKNLRLLAEKFPNKWEAIDNKNKEKWLTKEDFPTYNQLVEVAKKFNIPFGYLFLENIPEKKLPIPHFRTFDGIETEISEELYETIMQVKKQQEWIKDILIDLGHTTLPFANKFDATTDVQVVVNEMRNILGLELDWASNKINWQDAFSYLIEKFESVGVFVAVNGIVGNNTHRKLDVNEFRGFVLYDEIAPFVFINNNDFLSAKIFTLIHEFVHILIGQSASFDLRDLQSANNEIERFCDRCAAEFLVPTEKIRNIKQIDYENLARQFKVSQIVIARRLLDIGKITQKEFFKFYNEYKNKEHSKQSSQGGNFYNTANLRYGKKFLEILSTAVLSGKTLYRDFYRLLSLNPSTSHRILVNYLYGKY